MTAPTYPTTEPKFVPGERVVIVYTVAHPEMVGRETVITGITWGPLVEAGRHDRAAWRYKTPETQACGLHPSGLGYAFAQDQLAPLPGNRPATARPPSTPASGPPKE